MNTPGLLIATVSLTALLITAAPRGEANQVTQAAAEKTVIAAGLHNPRGLAIGPDGEIYVAEAGKGGDGPCALGPEGERCHGQTGAVVRIDRRHGTVSRLVTGLPSAASADGSFATGPHGITLAGVGKTYVTIGYAGDPANRVADFGVDGSSYARLVRATASGRWKFVADLGDYEGENNPTGDESDSNPYGVLALAGRTVVADAGANALNAVAANGTISTLAVFPDRLVEAPDFLGLPAGTLIPMDTVPTSVTRGPDGHFYVGQLTGFPFPIGGARIFRVPAQGGTPEVVADGFTAIVGLAFAPDGSLYVLELARNGLLAAFTDGDWTGALIRIAADGTRTEIAAGLLVAPGGIAIDTRGGVYVTNNSIFAGSGEVLRVVQ
jgi:sugar lactone lactonase YvrE